MIGGVGQRMLAGVAKKMAGQFFQAVDADIAGVRARRPPPQPRPACRRRPRPARPAPVAGAAPAVHVARRTRPPRAPGTGLRSSASSSAAADRPGRRGRRRRRSGGADRCARSPPPPSRSPPSRARCSPDSVKANIDKCVDLTRAASRPPAPSWSCCPSRRRPGSRPDCSPEELWDLVSELPGAVIEPLQAVARELGVHVVRRHLRARARARRRLQLRRCSSAPTATLLGVYRKTHPFCTEIRRPAAAG